MVIEYMYVYMYVCVCVHSTIINNDKISNIYGKTVQTIGH